MKRIIGIMIGLALLSVLDPQARADVVKKTTVTYYLTDAQGTVVAKQNAQGHTLVSRIHRPYGMLAQGAPQAGPGYTGHVMDPGSGLVYMQQRYYDPEVGRFISPDPVGPTPGNIFNFNRFAYANNNPIRFTDPDGKQSRADIRQDAWNRAYLSGDMTRKQLHDNRAAAAAGAVIAVGLVSGELPAAALTARGLKVGSRVQTAVNITKKAPEITAPYKRPSGATTKAQRASVQDKPCVDCGAVTPKQVADHKTPLVKEYYKTGTINKTKMRSVESVQPQCSTCSARQGAKMSRYSKQKKKELGL